MFTRGIIKMEENLDEVKGKKKFFQDKKNIAIIILSILLLFTLGSSSETSVETSTDLTSALTEKEQTIQAKQKQIEDLEKENNTLIQEKQSLESERNQLQEEKQNLETQKNELEQENKNLNEQVEQLKKTSSIKSSTSNTTTSTQKTQKSTTTQNTNSSIVYVTKTGEKYHKSSCSYLRQSKIQMNLSDAKAQGYTPCSRCY